MNQTRHWNRFCRFASTLCCAAMVAACAAVIAAEPPRPQTNAAKTRPQVAHRIIFAPIFSQRGGEKTIAFLNRNQDGSNYTNVCGNRENRPSLYKDCT